MGISDVNLDGYVTGICLAEKLDAIDIVCPVKKYDAGKKTKGILADDFPAYSASRLKAKELCEVLIKDGYKAKTSVGISIKNAAILCGIGSWGKNALIIENNKREPSLICIKSML